MREGGWEGEGGRCLGTWEVHMGSVLCLGGEWGWGLEDEVEGRQVQTSRGKGKERRRRRRKVALGTLVSGSSDCTIVVWSVKFYPASPSSSPSNHHSKQAHGEAKRETAGGAGGEMTMRPLQTLTGHSAGVLDIKMTTRWVVSCGKDGGVRVWERERGEGMGGGGEGEIRLKHILRGHEGPVNALGLSYPFPTTTSYPASFTSTSTPTISTPSEKADAPWIISASGDGKMVLWDVSTGEKLCVVEGAHERGLACVEFGEGWVVSGSNDHSIKVWSVSPSSRSSSYGGGGDSQRGEGRADEQRGGEGEERWKVRCEHVLTIPAHDALVRALAYDPGSGRLMSASYDRTVKVWDLSGLLRRRSSASSPSPRSSSSRPNPHADEREVEEEDYRLVREFRNVHESHIFDVRFDLGRIYSASHDRKVAVLDFMDGLGVDAALFV